MEENRESVSQEQEVSYEKLFRTAMFGFNKEDVLSYLERIARTRRKESDRYASHVHNLEASIDQLNQELASKQSGGTPAPVQESVLNSENTALRSENEMLKIRLAELEAIIASAVDTVADVAEQTVNTPADGADAVQEPETKAQPEDLPGLNPDALIPSPPVVPVPEIKPEAEVPAEAAEAVEAVEEAACAASEAPAEDVRDAVCAVREASAQAAPAALTALQQQLEAAAADRSVLEEKLRGYELEKARLSEIVNDAHQRAREIEDGAQTRAREVEDGAQAHAREMEDQAQARAREMHAEMAAQADEMRSALDELTARIDETSGAIRSELADSSERYAALRRRTEEMRAMLDRFC